MAVAENFSDAELGTRAEGLHIPVDCFLRTIEQKDVHTRSCSVIEIRNEFARFESESDKFVDLSDERSWPALRNKAASSAVSRFLNRSISTSYWSLI